MDLFERAAGKGQEGRPSEPDEQTIEGTVLRIVFSGTDGSFTVARLNIEGTAEPVTIVGALLGIPAGAHLRVRGRWEDNRRFGPQLRVTGYTEIAPETVAGIRRYLGSGMIKGIGPEFATRIVARFGVRTLEILDAEPGRIGEVTGIGPVRAQAITRTWATQRGIRNVMVFLQGYGVSPAFASRIYNRYGDAAIARVRENPYRLAFDVWGIGFLSADRLAAALGIEKTSDVRAAAGVRHALDAAALDGHVYLPRARLGAAAEKLLEIDRALVEGAIDHLAQLGELVIEAGVTTDADAAVYEIDLHRAENTAAQGLRQLRSLGATQLKLDVDRAIAWVGQQTGLALARQQEAAVRRALVEPILVITGGPGVGKTTIVRSIVGILNRLRVAVALAAPTGRAAKRLQEATGHPATTLHRLLEWRPKEGLFGRNRDRPLDADVLIVDEASMIDVRLAADLLSAVGNGRRLILVGDVDQLPSVGPGTVLRDIISSGRIPVVRLNEIFRQAAQSQIVVNAHRIHDGDMPEMGPAPPGKEDTRDFFFLEEESAERAAGLIRDLVTTRLPKRYGLQPHDIQVLCPMHRGDLGAGNLNLLLQDAFTAGKPELRRGQRAFRVGDRVMQVRNNYDKEVFNGDVGRIAALGPSDGEATVRFDDRELVYEAEQLDELALAYAMTVHKSQGSEYPAVIVPVHTQHYIMLARNLLYTAVTRGKRLVVLVGTRKALSLAVRNGDAAGRCSRLGERL